MAKTTLIDDGAAVVLLAGIVKQARKDLVRRGTRAENRVSAIELFMELSGYDDANETTGSQTIPAARAATGRSCTGAAAARGVPAPVGIRRIRRQ